MRKILSYNHPSFSLENVKGASNYKIIKSGRSFDLAYQLGAMTIIGLFSFSAHAECTPTPDCASIGYTETSCETDYLACPFDSTKLKCIPCDSSFRYDCTGDNITGGIGSACGGKYVSCECGSRTTFKNGNCVCDKSCKTIGNIVYSDKTCSSCVDDTKTAVAVVVHSDEVRILITPIIAPARVWSSSKRDVTALTNLSSADLAKEDMDGIGNSKLIREFFSSDNETNNAAWYCYNLEVEGFEDKKGEWYLPSAGELYKYFYLNYVLINNTFLELELGSLKKYYWSSSENNYNAAWNINSGSGNMDGGYGKGYNGDVGCLLAL